MTLLGGFLLLVAGGWGGVIFFAIRGIPFWFTFLLLGIYGTIIIFVIFYITDWVIKQLQGWPVTRNLIRIGNRVNNVSLSQKTKSWLTKRKEWIVLGLNFVPYVPILPVATIAAARIMQIKYALPILIFGNLIRSLALCLIVYYKIVGPGA
jgi:hypothetical protein